VRLVVLVAVKILMVTLRRRQEVMVVAEAVGAFLAVEVLSAVAAEAGAPPVKARPAAKKAQACRPSRDCTWIAKVTW